MSGNFVVLAIMQASAPNHDLLAISYYFQETTYESTRRSSGADAHYVEETEELIASEPDCGARKASNI